MAAGWGGPDTLLSWQLNRDLYEVMSKLDKQQSGKIFIVKGVPRYAGGRIAPLPPQKAAGDAAPGGWASSSRRRRVEGASVN